MKTSRDPEQREKIKAVEERPVGKAAEALPEKKKKLLNLNAEGQHTTGREKLATDEAVRDADRKR